MLSVQIPIDPAEPLNLVLEREPTMSKVGKLILILLKEGYSCNI